MLGRGAAAAADHIDQAGVGELAEQFRHELGAFVVIAELVRQPGVRVGAHERIGEPADFRDVGAHFLGAERAIEADGHRIGMPHGIPERRRCLPRQQAT